MDELQPEQVDPVPPFEILPGPTTTEYYYYSLLAVSAYGIISPVVVLLMVIPHWVDATLISAGLLSVALFTVVTYLVVLQVKKRHREKEHGYTTLEIRYQRKKDLSLWWIDFNSKLVIARPYEGRVLKGRHRLAATVPVRRRAPTPETPKKSPADPPPKSR